MKSIMHSSQSQPKKKNEKYATERFGPLKEDRSTLFTESWTFENNFSHVSGSLKW
jgi:hypothetical protein